MTRFSHSSWCWLAVLTLIGCGAAPAPTPAQSPKTAAPLEQLNRLVERYWDERIAVDYAISPQLLADSLDIERRYLAEVLAVPRDRLDANALLTYDIFKRQRELAIQGFSFPFELLPMNPFGGEPLHFAALAAAAGQLPASMAADYLKWPRRIDEYVNWTQQAIINMREGMRRGYTSPRVLIERMLPILERLGRDDSANVFIALARSVPESIREPQRSSLAKAIAAAVREKLLPANRALHDFLQHDYLPRARAGIALSELPLGAQWYAFRLQRATSTALSAEEIHRIGLAEVERIAAHAPPPREQLPQDAAAARAPSGDELVSAYQDLAVQARAALPKLFSEDPTDFAIRAADSLPEPATALFYQRPGPSGMPPAVLFVDTGISRRPVSIADFLQQALPGHHYQIALQQEQLELPRFRRYGAEPAFIEGWGLYAATLGEELGMYPDGAAKPDASAADMRCAVSLVVDTGLHAKGWTRTMASDYLHAHLAGEQADIQSLIDWYAANPADALACKMGELGIRSLKGRAQQTMGARFDIREFHAAILKAGAMPMDLLEARMKVWMEGRP